MKKIAVLSLAVVLLFSQGYLWAVWEGNAGIGSSGNFPDSGMYALSDMFPKNTLIDIQNLETGLSVRAVVVGLSGIPGLVASVSPEVAHTLNIKEGSVSRVRISIPLDTQEIAVGGVENVSGGGVETADPDFNPAALVAYESLPPDADAAVEDGATGGDALAERPPAVSSGDTSTVDPVEDIPADVAETVEAGGARPAEDGVVAVVPPLTEGAEENQAASGFYDEPAVAVVPGIAEKEPEYAADDEPVMEVAEIALVPAEMNPPPERASTADETVPEVGPLVSIPSGVPDDETEPVAEVPPTLFIPEDETVVQDVRIDGEDDGGVSEYISEYIPTYERAAEEASAAGDGAADGRAVKAENAGDVFSLPDSTLKKGYYVQIGTYSELENVRKIVESYSGKYPLAFLDSPASGVKKVLVGNLAADETGAILEFFRKEGFKDAFVYVIN